MGSVERKKEKKNDGRCVWVGNSVRDSELSSN
jgi:hypothetical protein